MGALTTHIKEDCWGIGIQGLFAVEHVLGQQARVVVIIIEVSTLAGTSNSTQKSHMSLLCVMLQYNMATAIAWAYFS